MKKPHKHAALIHAWADGETIEWLDAATGRWREMIDPQWCPSEQYRIKPQSKLDVAIEALEKIANCVVGAAYAETALEKIRSME